MDALSISQQDKIQESFKQESVIVMEESVELCTEISFPRLKALVEAIEDCVGTIDSEEE